MSSKAPPQRPDEERAATDDPDFGALRLIRQYFQYKPPGGGAWFEADTQSWIGALAGADLNINVREEGPFPELRADLRAALKRLASDAASFKRGIAARMLDLAHDWAESGDLPAPTLESLDAALSLTAIRVEPEYEIFLYFSETGPHDQTIFAGHVVEVRCELDGTIKEANLAG